MKPSFRLDSIDRRLEIIDNPELLSFLPQKKYQRIAVLGSASYAFLQVLNLDSNVVGVSKYQYFYNLSRPNLTQYGDFHNLSLPKLISDRIDLLIIEEFELQNLDKIKAIQNLGIQILLFKPYLSATPLEQLDWIRAFGFIWNKENQAIMFKDSIEKNYKDQIESFKDLNTQKKFKAVLGLPYENQWYGIVHSSYIAQVLSELGVEILNAVNTSGQTIETLKMIELLEKSDFWLHPSDAYSFSDMKLKIPFDFNYKKPIYNNNKLFPKGEGNNYWQEGVTRPDLIVHDLIRIVSGNHHNDSSYFYLQIKNQ
ncbi:MAG: hypothetical protein MUE53_00725 [Chitinophagales bacterium]|nr:hypothetical protein [Chitinophagales bacterium]